MHTYADVWLTYADVCRRMQTYADVCRRMADVYLRMQTYADSESQSKALEAMLQALEASARMLTYAHVC